MYRKIQYFHWPAWCSPSIKTTYVLFSGGRDYRSACMLLVSMSLCYAHSHARYSFGIKAQQVGHMTIPFSLASYLLVCNLYTKQGTPSQHGNAARDKFCFILCWAQKDDKSTVLHTLLGNWCLAKRILSFHQQSVHSERL